MTIPPANTSNQRWLAALAHAGILIPTFGLAAPLVIWLAQREKSAFLTFQALQALAFQLLLAVAGVIGGFLSGFLVLGISLAAAALGIALQSETPFMFMSGGVWLIFGLLLCALGLFVLSGLIAAIACAGGSNFRYPLLGDWLARYLTAAGTEDRHE
ncbi:MAG: DUF4870 domain-containing protein [Chloroflexota bacterium]|jgi:uncharacterized Tic20 family protein